MPTQVWEVGLPSCLRCFLFSSEKNSNTFIEKKSRFWNKIKILIALGRNCSFYNFELRKLYASVIILNSFKKNIHPLNEMKNEMQSQLQRVTNPRRIIHASPSSSPFRQSYQREFPHPRDHPRDAGVVGTRGPPLKRNFVACLF